MRRMVNLRFLAYLTTAASERYLHFMHAEMLWALEELRGKGS